MTPSDCGFDEGLDGDYVTERCRQCGDTLAVRADEPRHDGPFVCQPCISRTVNRATQSPLSNYLFDTAVLMARMR